MGVGTAAFGGRCLRPRRPRTGCGLFRSRLLDPHTFIWMRFRLPRRARLGWGFWRGRGPRDDNGLGLPDPVTDPLTEETGVLLPAAAPAPPPVGQEPTDLPAGQPVPRVVVPRWVQLVLLPLAILGLWALARAAGTVLLILIAASTFALILNPLVKILTRRGLPRGISILLVYVALFAALGGVGVLLSNPVSTQVANFKKNVPSIIKQANHDLANFQNFLNRQGIRVQIEHQGQTALQTLEKNVVKHSG